MGKISTPVDTPRIHLENILLAMEGLTFCKDTAARIVGGERKLERLIARGEIEAVKGCCAQNSKWKCNAVQVLMHCRNMRKRQ